ncbi:MAG: DUF4129 domain-containing protein [Acidimicrobiales bacterium]
MDRGRRMAGWLTIPAFLLLLALIGMAVTTEPKEDFQERAGDQSDRNGDGRSSQNGDGQSNQNQSSSQSGRTGDQDGRGDGQGAQSGRETDGGQGADSGQQPLIIRTENGEIVVELDENGNPRRVIPSDSLGPTDPDRVLTPDRDGGFIGLRVTEGGTVEPVEVGELQDEDFLIRPSGEGIDITRPDGSRVELTPTEDGELTGTEIAIDGTASDVPADDGDIIIQPGVEFGPGLEVDPDGQPIVIEGRGGPVRIELEPNGDLVANQPDQGDAVVMDIDDLSAIRIDENGDLEIVPLDEIGPDDTVLVPNDGGFDLVRPDGSRVEFRPDGENDGMTATEISPDGEATELTPNPDGSVTLEDGTTVGPIDVAEDGGPIEQLLDQTSDLPWPWVFGAIALLAALSIGTAVYLHRNRPPADFDYSRFATQGVPEDQLEKFLAVLTGDPDPTRSIRLAFYAVERGMAGLPTRRVDETPFEWHSRVEQIRPDLAKPLAPICDMFAMARFAPGQATLQDRDLMVEHLRELNWVAQQSAGPRKMAGV